MSAGRIIFNKELINEERYSEIQYLDELLRELQDQTLNEDWGNWHFALLNLNNGDNLASRICNTLSEMPKYKDPYIINSDGSKRYVAFWDLNNLTLETVTDLRNKIVSQAEHWAYYQGPSTDKEGVAERFHTLKYEVADKIIDFLQSKEIKEIKQVQGIDTYYSFGGDHCGEDFLVDTRAGVYLIHFGFSS